jgi:cytochrome c553
MFLGLSISRAGEPDFFTGYQLLYFRGETRKNEQMVAVVRDLTDDDNRDLGAYFACLPGPPDPDPDPAFTKEGAALVKDRHCVQCRLNTFVGQGEIGRLAGQHEEPIVNALHDYQHGARRGHGNVIMPEIVYSLNDDDIKAIGHFMSRQPGK